MMLSTNMNTIPLFLYLLTFFILSPVHSIPIRSQQSLSFEPPSSEYKRLATQCFIDDYAAWLEQQNELMVWLAFAKLLKLPVEDSGLLKQALEQFRLQHQCLRVIERLPLAVGPG
ncbi:unnamed protein product [Adineta steineri]|uniref:Uncharacterized protein n=1 Tax=Adineta steineri TaxID=433720 RepID=A0A813VD53_9BILA|nr:unnamed protein product [Adineta steineri]CAF0835994.1 unnamed protein product [Adineta steineri]CAF0899560.1 unnamed protein product [Adineta steineri]CAF3653712.1 unnamed protein product [Adineta steineri]CAF3674039.1 unnamed protein product [Adineta steineri]